VDWNIHTHQSQRRRSESRDLPSDLKLERSARIKRSPVGRHEMTRLDLRAMRNW